TTVSRTQLPRPSKTVNFAPNPFGPLQLLLSRLIAVIVFPSSINFKADLSPCDACIGSPLSSCPSPNTASVAVSTLEVGSASSASPIRSVNQPDPAPYVPDSKSSDATWSGNTSSRSTSVTACGFEPSYPYVSDTTTPSVA